MRSSFLWDYTSADLGAAAPGLVAFQPVGSVEQHGPHLPLGTDSMIVSAFAQRLRQRFEAENYPGIFLPLLPFGNSNEHIDFPGTITYSANTFLSALMDVGRSCARAGFSKLVFLNGHGGNTDVLAIAARELRIETGLLVFVLNPLITILPADPAAIGCPLTPEEARLGIHAGRVETSVILREHPELVHLDRMAADYPSCFNNTEYLDFSGRVAFGWIAEDVSKTGAIGDPVGATAEEGEAWLAHVTDMLYEASREILAFEIPGQGSKESAR